MFKISESNEVLDGVLIEFGEGEQLFLTESDAEHLRWYLNKRTPGIKRKILCLLKEYGKMSMGEITDYLNFNILNVEKEITVLESEGRIIRKGTRTVEHSEMGEIQIPLYEIINQKPEV